MDMAAAAEALGLMDVAVWVLEQARQKDTHALAVNRALARAVETGSELANLDFSYRDIGRLLDEWQQRLDDSRV
jgi:hypothetical protein